MGSMETPFDALPTELVVDVLGRVAAASFTDFRSAKRSCKEFLNAAKEDSVHRKVSLESFPVVQWRDENGEVSSFLDRCRRSKNLEALFRKGAVDYFGGRDPDNAFECLEEAAKSGHEEASYTLAIICLFNDELKQRGMKDLSAMKKSGTQKAKMNKYRQRLKNILKEIWVKNDTILNQPRPTFCTAHPRRSPGWDGDEEYDGKCEGCSCEEEIAPICDALPLSE